VQVGSRARENAQWDLSHIGIRQKTHFKNEPQARNWKTKASGMCLKSQQKHLWARWLMATDYKNLVRRAFAESEVPRFRFEARQRH
jgi:hypothetical protein